MTRDTLSASGYVLSRDLTVGGYERIGVLSADEGFLRVMRRLSAKTAVEQVPDIFDHCAINLRSRQGGAWFLSEYEVLRRYSGIGAKYDALDAASTWAALASANAPELESCAALCEISAKLFDSLDRLAPPQPALLKAIYLFAKSEGLPAREEWLVGLINKQRKTAETVLRLPLDEAASAASNSITEDVTALNRDIVEWMCRNHDMVPPRHRADNC
jgi:hypothetical protein